jgi:hypothetical protein
MTQYIDLTFGGVDYGRFETPWSLNSLLYKGLSDLPINIATKVISDGGLLPPTQRRIELAVLLFENLRGALTAGKSSRTVKGIYQVVRSFYAWADERDYDISAQTVERCFLDWTEWMFDQTRGDDNAHGNAFSRATRVGTVLDEILNRERRIMSFSRLRKKRLSNNWARSGDKLNLQNIFILGPVLTDLCSSLSAETIKGGLPALLNFRTGKTIKHWCRLARPETLRTNENLLKKRQAYIAEISWRTRHPLMNVRIEAEILIFISQTQANLTSALTLANGKFSYESYSGGYQCKRIYKSRRRGEVEFNIYSEYRPHFEAYLAWRNEFYPNEGLLFPLVSHRGRPTANCPSFHAVRKVLAELEIPYTTPRELRLAKINWLLRRTRDPAITAEMAQHEESTLLRTYEQPNHQAAVSELTRYHQLSDPAFTPPGPGVCVEPEPIAIVDIAKNSPKPDCINPAGCLYCKHQRDIATLDHVWSLTTYRYLKSLELASHRPTESARDKHPAHLTIELITEKLNLFRSNPEFSPWVEESLIKLQEGNYHPKWDGFVKLNEMRV